MTDFNIIVGVQSGDALRQLGKVQQGVKKVGDQTRNTSAILKQHSAQYNKTAVSMNKFGKGALQQAGYQVADFAVQIQNGTNILQAFGQQGSQMLAVFGPLGSVMGAVVAVGAAVGTMLFGMGKAGKDSAEGVQTLSDALKNLKTEAANSKVELEMLMAGMASLEEYTLTKEIEKTKKELQNFLEAQERLTGQQEVQLVNAAQAEQVYRDQIAKLEEQLHNLKNQGMTKAKLLTLDDAMLKKNQALLKIARLQREAIEKSKTANQQYAQSRIAGEILAARTEAKNIEKLRAANAEYAQSRIAAATLHAREEEKNAAKLQQAYAQYYRSRILGEKMAQEAGKSGFKGGRGGDPRQFSDIFKFYNELEKQEQERYALATQSIPKIKAEVEKLTPHMEAMQRLATDIGQSFENAFMSVVKGTMSAKDAFRSMAVDIIAELYRVFVVKKITGFVTDVAGLFLGSGPGSSASMIGARASGGPVSARRPYMVGERGPELMIPSASGSIVPNNKLGGGGVTVNQTINVTTGVQQTVRNEIQTLLPQIAEASKAAVLDARRRGGSFANAF